MIYLRNNESNKYTDGEDMYSGHALKEGIDVNERLCKIEGPSMLPRCLVQIREQHQCITKHYCCWESSSGMISGLDTIQS